MMQQPACYLPPEWATQRYGLLTWPHPGSFWDPVLPEADKIFAQMAYHLARLGHVIISCQNTAHRDHVEALLQKQAAPLAHIQLFVAPSNDVWVRDHGPITVLHQGQPTLLDFTFNGWGDKYPAELDNQITQTLHRAQAFGPMPLQTIDFVLEGGSVEVDGQGTLLTTARCLHSPKRNPGLSTQQLTERLQRYLGVSRVLWLHHGGLEGDDTDGHIDTLARFCDPQTICYVRCDDPNDTHYADLSAMEQELKALRDTQNQPYQLVPLPWPRAKLSHITEQRLPASYANFLIFNGAVLAPIYEDPADDKALAILTQCFPQHEIIPIVSTALIENFGSIHCATMQIPV